MDSETENVVDDQNEIEAVENNMNHEVGQMVAVRIMGKRKDTALIWPR